MAKMHRNWFWLRLRPRPRWGSLALPRSPSWARRSGGAP